MKVPRQRREDSQPQSGTRLRYHLNRQQLSSTRLRYYLHHQSMRGARLRYHLNTSPYAAPDRDISP